MEAASTATCLHCGTPTLGELYCCRGCESLSQGFLRPAKASSFLHLDQQNFRDLYQLQSESFDFQLYVEGMHCSSCIHLIEKLPEFDSHIERAQVNFGQSKLLLKVRDGFSLAKSLDLLASMGYTAHFLKNTERVDNKQNLENKQFLKKLAVAGACAGNIMLFVIPVYSGLEGNLATIFNWVSFALFLPILFYSATIFYRSAWSSLITRSIHIDLPITIALWSGFIFSTVNLVRGDGAIYFDSTASFIFLILCSRFILKKIQQKYLAAHRLEDLLEADRYQRLRGAEFDNINIDEIKIGDRIKLERNQINPVEGIVESNDLLADISVLNGEPLPRKFEKGMELPAGSRILSTDALLTVRVEPTQTHLARTIEQLQAGFSAKSNFVTITDRCAQVLIVVVFALAIGFFLIYSSQDFQEAFNRSLALIVLACPCALALGSPLTLALAVRLAHRQGILIKNTDSLEKVLKLKNIFFDKTGTLTEPELRLMSTMPTILSAEVKSILISLEQKSYHPIAFALRAQWPDVQAFPVKDLQETFTKGVSGYVDSHFYELGHGRVLSSDSSLKLELLKDGELVCCLEFDNPIRRESASSIQNLQNLGINCYIISGDTQGRVESVGKQCGVQSDHIRGGLSADQKRDIVKGAQQTCMIGDGTNDALSLQAATVGIAIRGSTQINLQAADICFTRGGLSPLVDLFAVARQAKRVMVRNLTLSLMYNSIGGALALTGFVSPWLAAILMPISSALILISTLWGLR